MSNTKERRQSYAYRQEYLKHNKGLFGFLYFCSQCGRPLTKDTLEVDHIVPLSKKGVNHIVNCVAICHKCNQEKSNKLDGTVYRGMLWKVLEEILICVCFIVSGLLRVIRSILVYPIKNAPNRKARYLVLLFYVILLIIIIMRK